MLCTVGFYGGMVEEIYTQFAVTMCIALSLSTVVALTLSALCAIILRGISFGKKVFKPVNYVIDGSKNAYIRIVSAIAGKNLLTAAIFVLVVGLAYFLFGFLNSSFIPREDKGTIMCDIELSPGATLSRTMKTSEKFSGLVSAIDGVKNCMVVNGRGMISGDGENTAMLIIELDDWSERKSEELSLDSVLARVQGLSAQIPEAKVICFTPLTIMGLAARGDLCAIVSGSFSKEIMEEA
ncbi:MAG: efflux RND transporter permease subunit [Bacilli bacterium]